MPLYRVLENLVKDSGRRIPEGVVDTLKGVSKDAIAMLLEKGRIAEVHPPPLAILPGWEQRAELLATVGIVDVCQLLMADLKMVAKELDVSVEGLQRAAKDARSWIEY